MENLNINNLKIAIVHDVLDYFGGAERVVESLLTAFPQAHLFVSKATHNSQTKKFYDYPVYETFIGKLPFYKILKKLYTPLLPYAFESLDLRSYDIIISSTAHFAKAVITKPKQLHICYCHTPPRFLYHYPSGSKARSQFLLRPIVALIDDRLRNFDYIAAQRPDYFITNSLNTASRIKKYYRRDATVIYPPVDIDAFAPSTSDQKSDYFFINGRLDDPYKNVDTVVEAFNQIPDRLIVSGSGKLLAGLKAKSKSNIEFKGFVDQKELIRLYKNARAFIFSPSHEDFGITAIEALASGIPVIALNDGGGAAESIIDGVNGVHYHENTAASLLSAISHFKECEGSFKQDMIVDSVKKFSQESFTNQIKEFVREKYQNF